MSRYFPLTVTAVKPETRDAILVTFGVPAELERTFRYRPGQHLNLRYFVNGQELRRSYSICSAVQDAERDRHLCIAIKRQAGGVFSNWANDTLMPGTTLEVMPPIGKFHLLTTDVGPRAYLAVAVGSGITPILAIIKSSLHLNPECRFTLIYGNRASSNIMFREELSDLKDTFLDRLAIIHIMTRELQDVELLNGRVTGDKLGAIIRPLHLLDRIDDVFLCGPGLVNQELAEVLRASGVSSDHIHLEKFVSSRPAITTSSPLAPAETRLCDVTAIVDGRRHSFAVESGKETILDAGLRQGIDLRYSCRSGVCATCRARLLEGQVDMDGNFALEDYEIARGFILTCQSHPVTDRIVVDFDQDT